MNRIKWKSSLVTGCLLGGLLAIGTPASAQFGGFADPGTMDEFNNQSVTGGLDSRTYTERARDAANPQRNLPSPPGSRGAPTDLPPPSVGGFGAPADLPPPPDAGAGPAGGFGGAGAQIRDRLTLPKAWGGTRVIDRVTGEIISDGREIQILPQYQSYYYNDGKTGNDAAAEDDIWTNIVIRRDYVGPEAHQAKTRAIRMLSYLEELSPMDFRQVRVATTEPLSELPNTLDLEDMRDQKLREWARDFLRDYRVNPEQIDSEFYPTFLPAPPKAPRIPLPPSFNPRLAEDEEEDEAGQGGRENLGRGGGRGGGRGAPANPGASSQYF